MIKGKMVLDLSPLDGMKKSVVSKLLRQSQTEASKIVRTAVKNNAAGLARYGFLAKSIGSKIKTYQSVAVAIVGPRSKWTKERGHYTRGKKKGNPRIFRPSAYAHLLEGGAKHTKAKHFLSDALTSTQSAYFDALTNAVGRRILALLK